MALTALVTKKSVHLIQDKLYNITVNLSLKDGTTEVINQDFSVEYRTGDNISTKQADLLNRIQTVINNYKAEQGIFTNAALNTVVTNIQNGLTL